MVHPSHPFPTCVTTRLPRGSTTAPVPDTRREDDRCIGAGARTFLLLTPTTDLLGSTGLIEVYLVRQDLKKLGCNKPY